MHALPQCPGYNPGPSVYDYTRMLSEGSSHILAVFWLNVGMEFQKIKPEGTQV